MKLTVLIENTAAKEGLAAEFGLSMLVEQGDTRLLFDTGLTGAFIDNAAALGIDLSRVTDVAFSHNHRDHCGGFLRLAAQFRPQCPVYVRPGFFRRKWWDHAYDDPPLPEKERTVELVGPVMSPEWFFQSGVPGLRTVRQDLFPVGDGVYLLGGFPVQEGIERVHVSQAMDGPGDTLVRDTFRDEQVCVVRTKSGLAVLTGCAHNGICTILRSVKEHFPNEEIHAVYGGTHLVPPVPERIDSTVRFLKDLRVPRLGACHCTGPAAMEAIRGAMPVEQIGSGTAVEIP